MRPIGTRSFFLVLLLSALAGCKSPAAPPASAPAAALPAPQKPPNGVPFRIDAASSQFTAQIGVSGALSVFGHDHTMAIREFAGEVRLTPGTIEPAWLRLTIKAASLAETGGGFSENDRRKIDQDVHEKALEISKHPQIVFESASVAAKKLAEGKFQLQISGTLTLHGVAKPVTIPAEMVLQGDTLTARGTFSVRHGDFGIERLSAAAGTVKAKDEIVLAFTLVARKGGVP
jgi:polyisoprenoid-binding protein YceI